MNSKQFTPICERISKLIHHKFLPENLKDEYANYTDYEDDHNYFLENLASTANKIQLTTLKDTIEPDRLTDYLLTVSYPILSFSKIQGKVYPVVLYYNPNEDQFEAFRYSDNGEEIKKPLDYFLSNAVTDSNGLLTYAVPFAINSMVSDDNDASEKLNTPVKRLFSLLRAEKRDIIYIYFYAIIISSISLVLPVGVQAVIEMVAGGVVFRSLFVMIGLVIIATLIGGGLNVMQLTLVEVIQRRIFVKAAFELAYRIPKMKVEALMGHYAPELINRFFEVLTIQKSLPKLLIDLTGALLQIVFGLLLLSFYHPFFIAFSVILLSILGLLFYYTGPKGLSASLVESKYKYKVAHWLEEIARTLYSFKLAGNTNLAIEKTNDYTNSYLKYRKKQFQVLMSQFIYIIGFKTIVTGGLLIIGSWLVINRQITLGQFVASEIVIVLVLLAVEKLILSIETIYHSLTAVEKIGFVTDIELEKTGGIPFPPNHTEGMEIHIKDLSFSYPHQKGKALNNLTMDIKAGERVCVTGFSSAGKGTLVKLLSGFFDNYEGVLTMNDISLRDMNLNSLRDNIAKNVSEDELFDGTILENISMGRAKVNYDDVVWALKSVDLWDYINTLPKGLLTEVTSAGKVYSESVSTRLILARCIAEKPKLLILNKAFQAIEKEYRLRILSFLMDKSNPWTIVCTANDPIMYTLCDRIIVMKEGRVVCEGDYEKLLKNKDFQECLINYER